MSSNAKKASLLPKYRNHIVCANRYLQRHSQVLNRLRNNLGGHFQLEAAEHATRTFAKGTIGKFESAEEEVWALRLDFANDIVVGGLDHSLGADENVLTRFRDVFTAVREAYPEVQKSAYALVAAFLLPKFA